ncbi:hypothetical protein VUR80DRAFT_9234 [Thermomyces stellatus]
MLERLLVGTAATSMKRKLGFTRVRSMAARNPASNVDTPASAESLCTGKWPSGPQRGVASMATISCGRPVFRIWAT